MSGCLLEADKPDIAIDVPQDYKFTTSKDPEAALPSLDWWEGFRSAELTQLMREAQAANLDIAIAIAQILQADAQVRITGAGLLPLIDFQRAAIPPPRRRSSSAPAPAAPAAAAAEVSTLFAAIHGVVERELHRRFLGQEPGGA